MYAQQALCLIGPVRPLAEEFAQKNVTLSSLEIAPAHDVTAAAGVVAHERHCLGIHCDYCSDRKALDLLAKFHCNRILADGFPPVNIFLVFFSDGGILHLHE